MSLSRISILSVGGAAIASSVTFFVRKQLRHVAFSGMYPRTPSQDYQACYVAAIPFFQNTVAGDLFYATLLFGGFRVAELLMPRLRAGQAQPA